MGSLNRCAFIGNLGRDAETRYTADGTPVASFSLACNDVWNDKAGKRQEHTEWVRCSLWGKQAESLGEYLTKGKQVYAEGKMQIRKWQDKQGNDKYTTEIRVDRVVLLGGGAREQTNTTRHVTDEEIAAGGGKYEGEDDPDAIPF